MPRSAYAVRRVTDALVLLIDLDRGMSVTNDAEGVIAELDRRLDGGLAGRRVYYRDTTGRFDELRHEGGRFAGFALCSEDQQGLLGLMAGERIAGDGPAR